MSLSYMFCLNLCDSQDPSSHPSGRSFKNMEHFLGFAQFQGWKCGWIKLGTKRCWNCQCCFRVIRSSGYEQTTTNSPGSSIRSSGYEQTTTNSPGSSIKQIRLHLFIFSCYLLLLENTSSNFAMVEHVQDVGQNVRADKCDVKPCIMWKRGLCKFGDQCFFRHAEVHTKCEMKDYWSK